MKITLRLLALVVLLVACGACNRRESPLGSFQPSSAPWDVSGLRPGVFALSFQPGATLGAGTLRGTVLLTAVAPAGGVDVSLSNGDPALLSLPSAVMVPAGSDTIQFSAATQAVGADRNVTVAATSAAGRVATTIVSLWALLPTFFSFSSEPGDYMGGGGIRRLYNVSARCGADYADFSFWGDGYTYWYATFKAPKGAALAVGTYEGATRYPSQRDTEPGLFVRGEGRTCETLTGRFVVREMECRYGYVRHFWASFEQHCEGKTPALYGDVRVTN